METSNIRITQTHLRMWVRLRMIRFRPSTRKIRLTLGDRLVLRLSKFQQYAENIGGTEGNHLVGSRLVEYPDAISQDRLADFFDIDRRNLMKSLSPLCKNGLVCCERKKAVRGVRRKRNVYILTSAGLIYADSLKRRIFEGKLRARDLDGSLKSLTIDELMKYVNSGAFHLRIGEQVVGKAQILEFVVRYGLVDFRAFFPNVKALLSGRREELKSVVDTFEETRSGSGRFVFIEGELGIGKTRLVREFEVLIDAEVATFLRGEGLPEKQEPFFVFTKLLERGVRLGKISAEGIKEILSETTGTVQHSIDPTIEEDVAVRTRVSDKIKQKILEKCNDGIVIVTIEDLHWVDVHSIRLLLDLSRELNNCKIMVILTYRKEEIDKEKLHWLYRIKENLAKNPRSFKTIRLGRLDRGETSSIIGSMIGATPGPKVVEYVRLLSEGIPLFVEHIVLYLIERGLATSKRGRFELTRTPNQKEMPPASMEIIGRRFALLSDDEKMIGKAAALQGTSFRVDYLKTMLHRESSDIGTFLDSLKTKGFIEETEAPSTYKFTHSFLREYATRTIPSPELRIGYEQLAEAVDEEYKENRSNIGPDLAHWFLEANDPEKALKYLLIAGDAAQRKSLHEKVIDYYAKAQNILVKRLLLVVETLGNENLSLGYCSEALQYFADFLVVSEVSKDLEAQYRANLSLGKVYYNLYKWSNSKSHYARSLELALKLEKKSYAIAAYCGLGRVYLRCGKFHDAVTAAKEAARYQDSASYAEMGLLDHLLGLAYCYLGEHSKGIEYKLEALSKFEASPDQYGVADLCNSIADSYREIEEWDKALGYALKSESVLNNMRYIAMAQTTYCTIAEIYLQRMSSNNTNHEELSKAEKYLLECLKLAEERNNSYILSIVYFDLGRLNRLQRNWGDSKRVIELGMEKILPLQIPYYEAYGLQEMAYLYKDMGETRQAFSYFHQALTIYTKLDSKFYQRRIEREIASFMPQ